MRPRPKATGYSRLKPYVLEKLREGYGMNDINRSSRVPHRLIAEWRDQAGIPVSLPGAERKLAVLDFLP